MADPNGGVELSNSRGKRARAAKIPLEKWEEYKDQIRALYETTTLENVMSKMARDHDFAPR
jgi:hypothetical protein